MFRHETKWHESYLQIYQIVNAVLGIFAKCFCIKMLMVPIWLCVGMFRKFVFTETSEQLNKT